MVFMFSCFTYNSNILSNIKKIGIEAFSESGIEKIILGQNIKVIEKRAFYRIRQ